MGVVGKGCRDSRKQEVEGVKGIWRKNRSKFVKVVSKFPGRPSVTLSVIVLGEPSSK